MAKNLVIVESPNKVQKIQSFLPSKKDEWLVMSSVGHIRNLSTWGTRLRLGIDLDKMEPQYIELKDKKEIIVDLQKEALKAENIYLATDPDREGEAIGWHIKTVIEEVLKKDHKDVNFYRVSFDMITKEAVLEAIEHKGKLNMDLVHSQEARRMLDRIIGFRLSFLTKKKVQAQSAGRVKSAALRMIIERQDEIDKFVPETWSTIEGIDTKKNITMINVDAKNFSTIEYETNKAAALVLKKLTGNFTFIDRKTRTITINPPKPLEMATYLMGMYTNYKMSNTSATIAAQKLYEKGIISYPRTDSTRIGDEKFVKTVKEYVKTFYDEKYYLGKPQTKAAQGDQDAHEAIRPADIEQSPQVIKDLKINEKKAYTFIWQTTIKAFLTPGKNKTLTDVYQDKENYFVIRSSIPIELGFRIVDGLKLIKETAPKTEIKLEIDFLKVIDHETKPPAKYNQASLIKKMKEVGIGRPSTYANTTQGLINYQYLESKGGTLTPTELAYEVNHLLQKEAKFDDIINEEYTSWMEKQLDLIARKKVDGKKFIKDFFFMFEPRIEEADLNVKPKPPVYIDEKCPECGKRLEIKRGRFGKFIACENFPECKYSAPLVKKEPPLDVNRKCPECGAPLVMRTSRYGTKFIGCSNFPKCNFIEKQEKTAEILLDLGEITKEQSLAMIKKAKDKNAKKKLPIKKIKKT